MNQRDLEHETEHQGPIIRVTNEYFDSLPKEVRGLPMYFIVLNDGQIKIWPALDTAQVIFKCHLV